MVKIVRTMAFLNTLKGAYHKPFWEQIKYLWSEFRESNPAVAAYAPLAVVTYIPLIAVIWYGKTHANPVAKYYSYINIYRPDDPRVPHIRKDSSLKYRIPETFDSIFMPNTI